MEIDLVYMWVDGSDPVWRAKKARYAREGASERADASGDCRFVENDELRYALRSVEKFAPWVRRIFIVTDNQIPAWLDLANPRVQIVDHREILPADALPVFNSSAIEWALPNIPGLSEHFLLANDDTFFGRPVGPGFFFAPDGFPYVRLKRKHVTDSRKSLYSYKLWRMQQKIRAHFGKRYKLAPHHNIDAYCRSEYLACAACFRAEAEETQRSRFRRFEDLQRSLVAYFALARGHAHLRRVSRYGRSSNPLRLLGALLGAPCEVDSRFFPAKTPDLHALFRRFNPALFCLNDDETTVPADRRRMREFLEDFFPEKSAFEK